MRLHVALSLCRGLRCRSILSSSSLSPSSSSSSSVAASSIFWPSMFPQTLCCTKSDALSAVSTRRHFTSSTADRDSTPKSQSSNQRSGKNNSSSNSDSNRKSSSNGNSGSSRNSDKNSNSYSSKDDKRKVPSRKKGNNSNSNGSSNSNSNSNGNSNNDRKHFKTSIDAAGGENLWKFTPRQFRAVLKNDVIVRPTTTENVYCCTEDNKFDLNSHAAASKEIFSSRSKFIPPFDFNFALPENNLPEFAFIGRSNVGKSSLIGALVNDEKLVRISREPGCTKTINYFAFVKDGFELEDKASPVNGHMLYLVDLPGYGFAKVSKQRRLEWKNTIDGFVLNRSFEVLRRVYLLIDSRHGVKNSDVEMMLRLNAAGTPYQVVLTKIDLCTPSEKKAAIASVFEQTMSARMCSALPYVFCVSTTTGEGLEVMRRNIAGVASFNWMAAKQSDKIMELTELDADARVRAVNNNDGDDDDDDVDDDGVDDNDLSSSDDGDDEIDGEVVNDLASGVKRVDLNPDTGPILGRFDRAKKEARAKAKAKTISVAAASSISGKKTQSRQNTEGGSSMDIMDSLGSGGERISDLQHRALQALRANQEEEDKYKLLKTNQAKAKAKVKASAVKEKDKDKDSVL